MYEDYYCTLYSQPIWTTYPKFLTRKGDEHTNMILIEWNKFVWRNKKPCVVKRIKLDKRKGSRDKVIKKSLIIIIHCMLLSFISLYTPLKTSIKCESLGGTGGGGYYIKLLDFEKVCPLHSFCVPWNFMYSSSKCILHVCIHNTIDI